MPRIALLPDSDRPRERLLHAGVASLSDAELVALVFGGQLDHAFDLVERFGGARGLHQAGIGELSDVPGVGVARACQLRAALELGRRIETPPLEPGAQLNDPETVAARLGELRHLDTEELHVLALDTRNRLVVRFVAARGSLNSVHVSPRDVLRRVVRESAAAMIVAHNHPSGDPAPSADDVALTQRLADAGEVIGVRLLDHLVIARAGFHSFHVELAAHAASRRERASLETAPNRYGTARARRR